VEISEAWADPKSGVYEIVPAPLFQSFLFSNESKSIGVASHVGRAWKRVAPGRRSASAKVAAG
jgi:uncharacterized membrane protein YoaT (DUF817 family)